ncbi:MAG: hypothetical protein JWL70_700 [Acidimicrobiia bacterium]|nr:hypothetical protein [Acidimicrobiia bacterium]
MSWPFSGSWPVHSLKACPPADTRHDGPMRFWVHQAVEYLLAGALISQALQSPRPAVVGTAGVVLLLVAASGDGPLRAIGHLPRPVHRTLDLAMVVGLSATVLAFRSDLDVIDMVVMLGVAAALVVLVTRTDYRPKPVPRRRFVGRRPAMGSDTASSPVGAVAAPPPRSASLSSDQIGRRAGRMVGNGVRAWRSRRPGPSGSNDE